MFSNSIEFYNLGGLSKGINTDNITAKQYSRNPIIAKVLAKVEYIEELGEGRGKIFREHEEHTLSPELPRIEGRSPKDSIDTAITNLNKFEYLVIQMNAHPVKIPDKMEKDIQEYMEELGYASFSEFARDAIRDKLYGREFTPEFEEEFMEGLKDIEKGNVYSHEEVKEKFTRSSELT